MIWKIYKQAYVVKWQILKFTPLGLKAHVMSNEIFQAIKLVLNVLRLPDSLGFSKKLHVFIICICDLFF